MIRTPQKWQSDLFDLWAKNGYWGMVKAVTGTGKTMAGCIAMSSYHQMYPFAKILVIVPSQKVGKQWREEMSNYSLDDIDIMSYQQAINRMYRGGLRADCLILDECHRVSPSKESSHVMDMKPTHALGLSATPGDSVRVLGEPFYTVDWSEANIAPFYVHYAVFRPTDSEIADYDKWTTTMRNRATTVSGGRSVSLAPGRDSLYDMFVRRRRDVCYTFQSRIPHTIHLIEAYNGKKRMVVYTERTEQIRQISKGLDELGIAYSVCSDYMDTLSKFENHENDCLLLCKKLREGWNDPTLDLEILCATTTRELSHTQVVGRVQRLDPANPNKVAHIIVLVAQGTSDERIVEKNDFPKERTEQTTITSVLDVGPGIGDRQLCGVWF